jgi:signal transduction histidine kinase
MLARSIARPLVALTRASEAIAKGDFDQEVPTARPDEIGRLASAFNSMAREMGRSYLQTRALIANVSHDLKTPLTSILGFAQALRDGTVGEAAEVRELGGIIHEEAERIFAIVEDLLYLSQLEAGEIVLRLAPVDLDEVAARSLRRIESSLSERRIAVETRLTPGLLALGDAGKLERILDNLLDNARKYTPEGGRIELTVRRSPADNGAELTVFNSGSYIAPDELDRVFDRFYRTDRSRGSSTGGTGLGLAIVKDLVQLQRGEIFVESGRHDGTTFVVRLPLASAIGEPAPPASQELAAKPRRANSAEASL